MGALGLLFWLENSEIAKPCPGPNLAGFRALGLGFGAPMLHPKCLKWDKGHCLGHR